jgi:hypothetical protein
VHRHRRRCAVDGGQPDALELDLLDMLGRVSDR